MYAVVRTGGKQYRVVANDVIRVEKLAGAPGDAVALDVLMTGEGDAITMGSGVGVTAEIVEQTRNDTIIVFKKKRRHQYRRRNGHRQEVTLVKITSVGGQAPAKKAAAPEAAKPEAGALDASNLSLISGVGPTIEKKLRAAGITSWNDIAGWSADDITKWDAELKLGGRATREEWVEQAKELLAGKPPRAKADQAELASGEDK
jgi:large subunit ribosomal protein L21